MLKEDILKAIAAELEAEIRRIKGANKTASEGATDAESRAETKWDTGGLEASYLALGYAKQFAELSKQAESVQKFKVESFEGKPVGVGALVKCKLGGEQTYVFILPFCGGLELKIDGNEITVVTPDSPLAQALLKKLDGDTFALLSGLRVSITHVQ